MAKSEVLVRMKADTTNYDANIAKARRQLDQFKKDNLTAGGVIKQLSGSLMSSIGSFASVTAAASALSSAIASNIETARNFEKSMSQLSSLTGKTGADLEKLKGYAIELGSSTTLSASQVADAFKMIGSQQPQLLASGEALKQVTKYAITLSEAAGIELSTAAQTLSTSINQMGGDSDNAARYVNVLAAASQKGAGDIAWLGEALTKSATAAKAVGTDYEELVANLEQLAKAGFDASTSGTALRSIIMNLEKQANDNFKPSIVGLTQAFQNLSDAHLNITGYQNIVGKMFATQAMALADAAGAAKEMTEAITGTNTAEEQAKINTTNLDGALKSLSSAWEGLNLHINDNNGLLTTFVNNITNAVKKADASIVIFRAYWSALRGEGTNQAGGGADIGKSVLGAKPVNELEEVVVTGSAQGTKKTKASKGSTQKVYEEGSIGYQEQLVQKLTEKWKAAGDAVRNDYYKQLEAARQVLKDMQNPATQSLNITNIQGSSVSPVSGISRDFSILPEIDTSPLTQLESELERLIELQNTLGRTSPQAYQAIGTAIEGLSKEIDAFKGKDISNTADESAKSFQDAAGAIRSVGSAMQSIEDPTAKVMGMVAEAIASIALGFGQAIGKDAGSKGNVWYAIAAAAAGVASMVSTIQSIHSATGYAEGGVIKGNSYSGDSQWARVNAGEVILNRAQASNVAGMLEGGFSQNLHLTATISGEQIRLALNNNGLRTGRGEYITTNFRS